MPLITSEPPSPAGRAPWRGAVAGLIASLVFIVGLAVVARATRDGSGGVPRVPRELTSLPPVVDGGPAAVGSTDAGAADAHADAGGADAHADGGDADAGEVAIFVDAGPLEGPEADPDAGPAAVEGPPVIAADVVAVALPLVEECLKKALRFDPSLGGRATLVIEVGHGRLAPRMPGAPSPVLSTCVEAGASTLAWPTAAGDTSVHIVDARVVLDGLRKTVRVEAADLRHE